MKEGFPGKVNPTKTCGTKQYCLLWCKKETEGNPGTRSGNRE